MEYFARTVGNGESFDFSSKRLFWDIKKVIKLFKINGKEVDSNEDSVWNPVIDSVLGLCYTFNPKTFQNGSIAINYHAKNGQIHPAEIHIEFDVRLFSNLFLMQTYLKKSIFSSFFKNVCPQGDRVKTIYYEKKVQPKFFQNPFLRCPWSVWLCKIT